MTTAVIKIEFSTRIYQASSTISYMAALRDGPLQGSYNRRQATTNLMPHTCFKHAQQEHFRLGQSKAKLDLL